MGGRLSPPLGGGGDGLGRASGPVLVLLELLVVLLLLALLLLDKVQLPGCIVRRGVSPQAMSSYHSLPSLSLPPFAPGGGVHAPKNAFF